MFSTIDSTQLETVTGGFDFSPIIRAKDDQLKLAEKRHQAASQLMMTPATGGSGGSGASGGSSSASASGAQGK